MRRNIGKMRHRVEIFEPARTSDGTGGFSRGDAKAIEAYAELKPLKEIEKMQYAKLEMVRSHKCQMRLDDRIKQGYLLVYDGRYFYIEAIQNVNERDRFFELSLREGGPV